MILPAGIVAEEERSGSRVRPFADVGGVVDGRRSVGLSRFRIRPAVMFAASVAEAAFRALDREPELPFSAPSFVVIVGIVPDEGRDNVVNVHRAAEPFDPVIDVGEDLHVVDFRLVTHAGERQALDLVPGTDVGPTVADGDVFEDACIVGVVVPSVFAARFRGRNAFNLGLAGCGIQLGRTEDDHAAPFAADIERITSVERVVLGREDDGIVLRPFGHDLPAAGDDQG